MDRLFMRSPIVLLFSILLLLGRCDQTPTSLEEEPFIPASGSETLSLDLLEFDFDPLSRKLRATGNCRGSTGQWPGR